MDDFSVTYARNLDQETVCPRDVFLGIDGHKVPQDTTTYLTISCDDSEAGSDIDDSMRLVLESPKEETDSNDDWLQIHDLLFQSVGLERVPECWKMVQKKLESSALNNSMQPTPYPLISSDIRGQLIAIYFRQFHPICPAVDERKFLMWCQNPQQHVTAHPELMQLLHVSMMFAASPHLEENLLSLGPYSSVKQVQRALFIFAQAQYHRLETEFLGAEALAQSALLLSYWSPVDSTKEVNSYWSDEAIRHAVAGGMSSRSSTHRRRIIWCCCLLRNRMISLGLRRFSRLEGRPDGPLPTIADFGEEVSKSHFTSPEAKVYLIRAFILLCNLSRIMAKSVKLNHCHYNKTWSLPNEQQAADLMRKVSQLNMELNVWSSHFSQVYATAQNTSVPRHHLVIFHLLGLMHQFAISILYEPFLRLNDAHGTQAWFIEEFALLKIKEASTNTAAITASMLQSAAPKDLPIILPPWIILPIALHLVQLSERQNLEIRTETTQQLGYLMRALHSLIGRYEGARLIVRIINAIITIVRNAQKNPVDEPLDRAAHWQEGAFQVDHPQFRQGKVIVHVLEYISKGLADEVVQD